MNASKYEYRDLGKLGSVLVIMLFIDIGTSVISMVSDAMEISLLSQYLETGEYVQAEFEANDMRQGLIGVWILGYMIATLIVFGKWIYRAAANAHLTAPDFMETPAGWCVGWYFIPVMNLFKPFQAMREIWQASTASPGQDPGDLGTPGFLRLWWGMWLLSGILGQISFRLVMHDESFETYLIADYLTIGESVVAIFLALTAITLVKQVTAAQVERGEVSNRSEATSSCPECGEAINDQAEACPMCGASLEPVEPLFDV